MEDVDLNGYPPVEQYRETISEFADQVCVDVVVGHVVPLQIQNVYTGRV